MFDYMPINEVEKELGKRLKRRRLDRNLSQEALAERSGLSRRTIAAIEHGEGTTLTTLLTVLRALDALDPLDNFLPEPGISPIAMLKLQETPRKHAYKTRTPPPEGGWKWGDEP